MTQHVSKQKMTQTICSFCFKWVTEKARFILKLLLQFEHAKAGETTNCNRLLSELRVSDR